MSAKFSDSYRCFWITECGRRGKKVRSVVKNLTGNMMLMKVVQFVNMTRRDFFDACTVQRVQNVNTWSCEWYMQYPVLDKHVYMSLYTTTAPRSMGIPYKWPDSFQVNNKRLTYDVIRPVARSEIKRRQSPPYPVLPTLPSPFPSSSHPFPFFSLPSPLEVGQLADCG